MQNGAMIDSTAGHLCGPAPARRMGLGPRAQWVKSQP